MDLFKVLQTLTETPGPSGFESDIAAVVQEMWHPLVDEMTVDRLGSLIAIKKGRGDLKSDGERRPRILLAAHMDEIGLMVRQVIDFHGSGFLRVNPLGGVDIRHLYGQQVVIHGHDGQTARNIRGILGAPPNHLLPADQTGKPYSFDNLVVDPGMSYDQLQEVISVGDAVSFYQPLQQLAGKRVSGKALDNRCSVAAVTQCLEQLQYRPHDWDVIALASCQEETRLLGAATVAHQYQPDIAIAIDVTFGQGPGANDDRAFKVGGGPVISFSPDTHQGIQKGLEQAAAHLEMSTQSEYAAYPGGTDAYAMQIAAEGIPTGIVGIALRYMHTMVESISIKDVTRVGRLLAAYVEQLNENTTQELKDALMPKS